MRDWSTREGNGFDYKLDHGDTGSLVVSAQGTASLKATINVKWPWADEIRSYGKFLSMFQPLQAVGSHYEEREHIMDLLLRDIDGSTGSTHTLDVATQWLAKCKSSHAACSAGAYGEAKQLPTRVIDVGSSTQKPKLVETVDAIGRWAALSYCWGGNSSFILTSSSKPHFEKGARIEDFPTTLRDAIIITRALGIPYIWIDALCILQDSFDDWRREASRMKEVYSGADVVIAATCAADVNAGIFRTRPVEDSIELQWNSGAKRDDDSVVKASSETTQEEVQNQTIRLRRDHRPSLEETLGMYSSRWASRGWTMQEDFMATRLLLFQDQTVTWECLSKAENEDDFMSRYWKRILAASTVSKEEAKDLDLTIPSGFFNNPCTMWYKTVEEYSDRRLTKLTDAFQRCLGSQPSSSRSQGTNTVLDMEKRPPARPVVVLNDHLQLTDNGPSWSWINLEGWLRGGGQDFCHQFSDVVVSTTRIVDVKVDLEADDDPFRRVRGGKLTIEAAYLSWSGSVPGENEQPVTTNMRKFVAELLAHEDTELTAEYHLRHQPHNGQVTAVLLIDCNSLEGRALLVESVQDPVLSSDNDSVRLYRRVGRFSIRKCQPYDNNKTANDFNYVSPVQNAAYEDCAKGLSTKTFVII